MAPMEYQSTFSLSSASCSGGESNAGEEIQTHDNRALYSSSGHTSVWNVEMDRVIRPAPHSFDTSSPPANCAAGNTSKVVAVSGVAVTHTELQRLTCAEHEGGCTVCP